MKNLAILGASGHGKVIADAAEACGWQSVTFFDDAWPATQHNGSWRVQGDTDALLANLAEYDGVFVSIGSNTIRARKQALLMSSGANIVSIIHPAAIVSRHAKVGVGSVMLANAVVNAGAVVGDGVIVNTSAVVEHDCILGDFTHISPNAVLAGGVIVGQLSWVGAGAAVRQMLEIGENALVGMGAVVTKHVQAGATVIGNPARNVV